MGLYLLLLIRTLLFSAPPSLNVHDFGATGDGVTDDTQAINKALQAGHDQQANVYFPSGTYLCNTVDTGGNILTMLTYGLQGITIYGDGNTSVITTSLNQGSVLLFILAYGPCSNFTVKNLSFQNTHGIITAQTRALFFLGKQSQYFTNLTVSGCYFNGFSTALGGQGINTWTITTNYFGSPQGHDNAKNDTDPAVFLWLYDNSNGLCNHVTITNNIADGYSGTGPVSALVTHRPMDGFVFGTAYGITITGNTTQHFSEEHYNLQPRATYPNDTSTTLITGNYLDCSLPPGLREQRRLASPDQLRGSVRYQQRRHHQQYVRQLYVRHHPSRDRIPDNPAAFVCDHRQSAACRHRYGQLRCNGRYPDTRQFEPRLRHKNDRQ